MSQSKQYQKVKKMRAWKIACYMLGFPMFIFTVFCSAIKYMGYDPFTGATNLSESLGFFYMYEAFITGEGLYGLWIALAMWLLVSIFHLIISRTVKSTRARMFSVVAFCMVVLFGSMFTMDAIFETKITEIQENAAEGVVVEDYKTQLSYYRTMTSTLKGTSYVSKLKDDVAKVEKVYNVDTHGADKTGTAGNMANKPITYYNIISDDGTIGVDISFTTNSKGELVLDVDEQGKVVDGAKKLFGLMDTRVAYVDNNEIVPDGDINKEVEGNQVVKLVPNKEGKLVINGEVYSHYFYVKRGPMADDAEPAYTWYTLDLTPASYEYTVSDASDGVGKSSKTDGIFGEGIYNRNNTFADGWIFSLENVLSILEQYYEAEAEIANYSSVYKSIYDAAIQRRDDFYGQVAGAIGPNGEECDDFTAALYSQEVDFTERFTLTRAELDEVLALVGGLLGKNGFMDYMFGTEGGLSSIAGSVGGSAITDILDPILSKLPSGYSLTDLLTSFGADASITATVANVLDTIAPTYVKCTGLSAFAPDTTYYTYDGSQYYTKVPDGEAFSSSKTYYTVKKTNDVYIVAAYDEDLPFNYRYSDQADPAHPKHVDHLYIAVVRDDGAGHISTKEEDIILDLDFASYYHDIGAYNADGTVNYTYAFDLDNLSAFLNTALNTALDSFGIDLSSGILNTVLGLILKADDNGVYIEVNLLGTLKIYLMDKDYKHFTLDINGILTNLLSGLYSYQSPTIYPWYEFLVDPTIEDPDELVGSAKTKYEASVWYRQYYRAKFAGETVGALIGSTVIGDTLGDGTYSSDFGLADLTAVRQLQTDLSYMPLYYPLFSLRDMIMLFGGFVCLFYFLSFCAAEKEAEYAAGEIAIKEKKKKKGKSSEEEVDYDAAEGDADTQTTGESDSQADDWSLEDGVEKPEGEAGAEGDSEEASEDGKKSKKAKKEKKVKEKKPKKEKKSKSSEEDEDNNEEESDDEKSDVPAEENSDKEVRE